MVSQEPPVPLGRRVRLVSTVLLAQRVRRVHQALQVLRDLTVQLVLRVRREVQESLVPLVLMALLGQQAHKVRRVLME